MSYKQFTMPFWKNEKIDNNFIKNKNSTKMDCCLFYIDCSMSFACIQIRNVRFIVLLYITDMLYNIFRT